MPRLQTVISVCTVVTISVLVISSALVYVSGWWTFYIPCLGVCLWLVDFLYPLPWCVSLAGGLLNKLPLHYHQTIILQIPQMPVLPYEMLQLQAVVLF